MLDDGNMRVWLFYFLQKNQQKMWVCKLQTKGTETGRRSGRINSLCCAFGMCKYEADTVCFHNMTCLNKRNVMIALKPEYHPPWVCSEARDRREESCSERKKSDEREIAAELPCHDAAAESWNPPLEVPQPIARKPVALLYPHAAETPCSTHVSRFVSRHCSTKQAQEDAGAVTQREWVCDDKRGVSPIHQSAASL